MAVVSLITKLSPGTLNLVIFVSPRVISLLTVAELAAASCPINILLEPVVRSFVSEYPASNQRIVFFSPVDTDLPEEEPTPTFLSVVALVSA